MGLSQTQEAVALLWFYRQTQTFEERSATELAADFRDEGYPRPNPTRLSNTLRQSSETVSGRRRGTFQINSRYLDKLDNEYGELLSIRQENVLPHILPIDFARGERPLEQLVVEVNGSYERGWYNSCAVMLRRILESLIVSVFIKKKKVDEIRIDGSFLMLEALIEKIFTINQLNMARGAKKIMSQIKEIGDVAAHNRTYLTNQQDIDDIKLGARRVLDELLQIIS